VADAEQQILPTLRRVANIARSLGHDLALGGTHPFHRSTSSAVFPAKRYEQVRERLAWLTYQREVFGLHVHVGVPSGDMALKVMTQLIQYLPHLLALSSNSPFWQGVDTGLESCRAALYRLLPHAGVPAFFRNWKEFHKYCQVMRSCRAQQSFKDISWDMRPRPDLGTIEFRICDAPSSLAEMFGLVALTRCLVIAALRRLEERPQILRRDVHRYWLANENKWLATRYGLQAIYLGTPGGKRRPLLQDLAELIDALQPIAQETGDQPFLDVFQPLDHFETGSARQRRLYRDQGDWRPVIDDMNQRLGAELEPRTAPAGETRNHV
jgi:carboxylate-amine ligase